MISRMTLQIFGFAILSAVVISISGPGNKIDLNLANQADLESIPGIGPSYAKAIVVERDRRGGFRSIDDLLKIRGIGRKMLARLRSYVTVDASSGESIVAAPELDRAVRDQEVYHD